MQALEPGNRVTEKARKQERWIVVAPFMSGGQPWISDWCKNPNVVFEKVPRKKRPISWHKRGSITSLGEWIEFFSYARRALATRPKGIITCFPQLALVAALWLTLTRRKHIRLIAWTFNIGSTANRWKGRIAGLILRRVDKFIVHSRGEIDHYASWLGVDREKFSFVYLQRGNFSRPRSRTGSEKYILSMGSANRDYRTLLKAVEGLSVPLVIVSKKSELRDLEMHSNVRMLSGLNNDECRSLLAGAVMNVVPLRDVETAAGQVTLVTSLRMGVATIVSRGVGSIDYVDHGKTGILVEPASVPELKNAILQLWNDQQLRENIALAGKRKAQLYFSDEAAGKSLGRIVEEVRLAPR
jgi:glycosyltransferase involved in cell wall biosynthesis